MPDLSPARLFQMLTGTKAAHVTDKDLSKKWQVAIAITGNDADPTTNADGFDTVNYKWLEWASHTLVAMTQYNIEIWGYIDEDIAGTTVDVWVQLDGEGQATIGNATYTEGPIDISAWDRVDVIANNFTGTSFQLTVKLF